MPECAPVSTHPGQEGLREAGFRAKTGLEEPHGQRFPVTCLALDAKRALCSPSLGVQDRPASGTGFARSGGSAGLRGAPGDRIAGDPSSQHRIPPAPACVPVVWDTDPGIPARRGPHRIVRAPGAGDRRHAWWTVPPEPPRNLRAHGAGDRGANQHRQRRRPLPGNRVSTRPSDRGAGRDPPLGTPAPCGRDALAPRWTHLVAVDGQECPGHGLCPHT